MKVFVTGVRGQLGYDVVNELEKRGHEAVGVDIEELDITDAAAVEKNDKRDSTGRRDPLCGWTAVDAARGQCGQMPSGQCERNGKYREGLQRAGLQDDVHFHRLHFRWQGHPAMGAGRPGDHAV